jgi:hypothetical protein
MKKINLKYCFIIASLMVNSICYAQGNSGGSNGKGPPFPCPPNNPVCGGQPGLPIDGGIIWLVLAGTALGVYKLKKHPK